jgi:hypothetical protein
VDKWGNGPLAASSRPIGCGYPHVGLVMHVLNRSRHATARPKSSRHVDELLDECLAHLRGATEDVAVDT